MSCREHDKASEEQLVAERRAPARRILHYDTYPRQAGVNHMKEFMHGFKTEDGNPGNTNPKATSDQPVGTSPSDLVVPENE